MPLGTAEMTFAMIVSVDDGAAAAQSTTVKAGSRTLEATTGNSSEFASTAKPSVTNKLVRDCHRHCAFCPRLPLASTRLQGTAPDDANSQPLDGPLNVTTMLLPLEVICAARAEGAANRGATVNVVCDAVNTPEVSSVRDRTPPSTVTCSPPTRVLPAGRLTTTTVRDCHVHDAAPPLFSNATDAASNTDDSAHEVGTGGSGRGSVTNDTFIDMVTMTCSA